MGKKNNSVILMLGRVSGSPADHNVRTVTLKLYNSVDMLPHTQGEYNDENTKGYLMQEDLDGVLENIRGNLEICYHHRKINQVIREEDSK